MKLVEDMSTTTRPPQRKGNRDNDQENPFCADLMIVPMWRRNPS